MHVGTAEPLRRFKRQLEQARLQVTGEKQEIVRVDEPLLGVGAEEVLRVADDELVQRRARGHEDTNRTGPPPSSAQLLPCGCDGSGVPD